MRTLVTAILFFVALGSCRASETVSLAGQWKFALDPKNVGITEGWFNKSLPETVILPGSTDTNRKGTRDTRKPDLSHPSRLYEYTGAAWYQREITIPRGWEGKRIVLFLERCHWETQVWLDGKPCGMQDSLCVPHIHELSASPGVHRLAIRVDNTIKYNVGNWAHSITEETQTNWNGIVGRIELRATPKTYIESVQVYPDLASRSIRVKAFVQGSFDGIRFDVRQDGRLIASKTVKGSEAVIPIPNPKLWDEFSPNLYTLTTHVSHSSHTTHFALRDLRVTDKRLTLNGRKIFLRGTLECCIFPKTGYPPTDVQSWLRILRICKSYGLNHIRFHSWCPPEAAFQAADQLGFLFHVELPQWVGNVGQDPPRDQFIEQEMTRILDTYGNHPSFGMLCMGNELGGDASFLQKLVVTGQKYDPRHLYTPSTAWSHGEHDDYRVAAIRGLHGPTTDTDFSAQNAVHAVPVISHEIGQWSVFPNLAEIKKYTGVLRPTNFGLIRDGLRDHGILDQAADFTQASGKLSAQLYKEEIEVLLRTPGHGGFQLLDLHDFPGQGTALVGMLDAFWDSKGIITPEQWRRFCSPTVPLLRMSKRTWTTDETFTARVQVAHSGPKDISAIPMWAIRDQSGHDIASGILPTKSLPTGDLHDLGDISTSLAEVSAPAKLTITVSLKGTDASNSWNIWVYPAISDPKPSDVLVTQSIEEMTSNLQAGKRVLMLAPRKSLVQPGTGSPYTIFWSPILFAAQNNQGMGILCDVKHPALAQFPTDFHADWQWFDLLDKSSNMDFSGTPKTFRPIVQVIDNFIKNRKMGNLLEARVGDGRLMVCSMNLDEDKPACRQMLKSILDYMASDAFQPAQELTLDELSSFLKEQQPTALQSLGAKVLMVDSEDVANPATNAIDGDPNTLWHTQWQGAQPPYPHEIRIDLQKTIELTGFKYLPRQDMQNGWFTDYEFYVSEDGKDWGAPVAKGSFTLDPTEKTIQFAPCKGRYIRLVALKGMGNSPWAGIAELDVLTSGGQVGG